MYKFILHERLMQYSQFYYRLPDTVKNFLSDSVRINGLRLSKLLRLSKIFLFVFLSKTSNVDIVGNTITMYASGETHFSLSSLSRESWKIMRGFHARVTACDMLRGFDFVTVVFLQRGTRSPFLSSYCRQTG